MFITYEDYTEDQVSLKYNSTLAAEYMKNFEKMAEQFGLEDDVTVSMLSRCPEVPYHGAGAGGRGAHVGHASGGA